MSQLSGANRDNRANSFDSATSVGSTDSTDSDFSVEAAKSQMGHMGPKSVTTATANQKPSGFFGWLKSLLFGSGGGSSETTSKITNATENSVFTAKNQQRFDSVVDIARATQDNADVAIKLANEYDHPEIQTLAKAAATEGKAAMKAAVEGDEKAVKASFAKVRESLDKISGLIQQLDSEKKAAASQVVLHPTKSSEEPRDVGPSAHITTLTGRTAGLKGQESKGVSDHLESLELSKAQKLRGYMKEVAAVREKGEQAPLERSQVRTELERELKHEGIKYDAQAGVFFMIGEDEDISKKK